MCTIYDHFFLSKWSITWFTKTQFLRNLWHLDFQNAHFFKYYKHTCLKTPKIICRAKFYPSRTTGVGCITPLSAELTVGILKYIHARIVMQKMMMFHKNPKCSKKEVLNKVSRSHCLATFSHFSLIFFPPLKLFACTGFPLTLASLFCFTFKALQKLQKLCWKNHLTFIQFNRTFLPLAYLTAEEWKWELNFWAFSHYKWQ